MPLLQVVMVLYRSGCPALASESVHADGWVDLVDLECCSGDLRSFVAPEHFWTL